MRVCSRSLDRMDNNIRAPWPFAYQKSGVQTLEWKGRVNSNRQDMRHECAVFGVQSKCHRCEDIACGATGRPSASCPHQLQGSSWIQLPKNIPTVTDVPWAVGGNHRYDYGGGSRVCVFLSGGACISPFETHYSACIVRCWVTNSGAIRVGVHSERGDASRLPKGDAEAADIWSYPTNQTSDGEPQGLVSTLAGSGEKGFLDGVVQSAKFSNPQDVAVDKNGIVFVADTGNHLIRRIEKCGSERGRRPGMRAAVSARRRWVPRREPHARAVNSPRDVSIGLQSTVIVADGHRIRRINYDGTTSNLETISSSNRVVALAGSQVPGNVDGSGDEATFSSPAGVTVSADGRVYVVSPVTCKLRQVSTASQVARTASCLTTASQVLLPSGCSSYEPPVDELFTKVSPVANNIYYNYRNRSISDSIDGLTLPGREIEDCTGSPPIDSLSLRGHGKYGKLTCSTYRCPQYDEELISNDGHSFQSGCSDGNPLANPIGILTVEKKISNIRDYRDEYNTNRMSDDYFCGNLVRQQGDYTLGRSTRVNYVDVTKVSDESWVYGAQTPGEGVFMWYNKGSCIAPATCSCGDGWQGIDCNVPICRFLQANGSVQTGCMNDGVCVDKDKCQCVQIESKLNDKYPAAPVGLTGFFGSDRAISIFIQGEFDPSRKEISSAGVDGCYRCRNNGKCVSPDLCECAAGWSGFDCSTPICTIDSVNSTLRKQLFTVDDQKVLDFQADPCGTGGGRWGKMCSMALSILSVFSFFFLLCWSYLRQRIRPRQLLAKAERRRSRKNSEENPTKPKTGAFTHTKKN